MKFLAALIPSLLNLFKTLIGQILAALGITAITYVGLEQLLSNFKQQINQHITGLPNDFLQIFYISGGGTALNIVLGGLTFYASMVGLTKLTSRIGKNN